MTLHTGKHPATHDGRDLLMHKYVDTAVIDIDNAPPAKTLGHGTQMPTPRLMLGNGPDPTVAPGFEGVGNCVFAMTTNYLRLAWKIAGKGLFPGNGATAVANYAEFTPYVMGDPSTDEGTNMRTWMNQWRKTGYKDALGDRHKIGAWAKIDLTNPNHLLWAMYLCDEGVPLGVMFPNSAMGQFNRREEWKPVPSDPKPDEGHCILADRWTGTAFYMESWARDEETAPAWVTDYADEAYFIVDTDGCVGGKTLEGVDTQQLLSDASAFS